MSQSIWACPPSPDLKLACFPVTPVPRPLTSTLHVCPLLWSSRSPTPDMGAGQQALAYGLNSLGK